MKVCAIDGTTGIEIVTTCDANMSQHDMKTHARRILERRLEKEHKTEDPPTEITVGGKGIIV